ncbi:hypothetical protein [uncultured Jatrophihabitans sp.]|uniref:hypothetical protein n=1 Tax=uncultured Jatrophihabitans sp. TaxID=1610747 RepID=UPI0035CBFE0E
MRRDDEDPTDDSEDLVDYYLGGAADDASGRRASDRRTRRTALVGLAVVVVVVALAITLTSVLVDTSGPARGPRDAAQRWGEAFVHGDAGAQRRLECAAGSHVGDVLRLTVADAARVSTGSARKQTADRWSVPLEIDGADGSAQDSVDLPVVRESGGYRVC